MKKVTLVALINLTLLVPITPCFGQTAEQINLLLRKSKFVDIGRMVNTTVGADKTIISTYSNPKASDQDCKVTALLMMKELTQHYKSIHRIQVLFYDPRNPNSFRDIEIREGDTLLVDQGKPLSVVLSEIDVGHHTSAPTPNVVPARQPRVASWTLNAAAPTLGKSTSNANIGAQTSFQTFATSDGELTISYPKDWSPAASDGNFVLLNVMSQTKEGSGAIALYRHPGLGATIEALADQHAADLKAKSKNYREISRRIQTCDGQPCISTEASGQWTNGTNVVKRAAYVKAPNHLYMLDMTSTGSNDNDMSRLFQKLFASIRIRG